MALFAAMSLVAAYGSSDESGESDSEQIENNDNVPKTRQQTLTTSTNSELAEVENHVDNISDSGSDSENSERQQNGSKSVDTLLKGLPTPHATSADVIVEDDELEDEVKPKPSQVTDLPKPPPKRNKQPVKITVPALEQDSDEDEPAKKKPRPQNSGGKSGLTSLLPPPVHAAKKEANRILLPYSLGKKPKPNAKPTFSDKPPSPSYNQKKYSMYHGLTGYDSDSDENEDESNKSEKPVNFFSLDSLEKSDQEQVTVSDFKSDMTDKKIVQQKQTDSGIPTVSFPLPPLKHLTTDKKVSNNEDISNVIQGPSLLPQIDPDAPLTFKGGQQSKQTSISSAPVFSGYGPVPEKSNSDSTEDLHEDQNIYYNMPYDESSSYIEATDVKALEQDEEFLKLQGKPKRGKEEINILDVNTADFTSTAEVTKSLSEEQEHRSHKKKDMPSSQQRKKHQIGFLAFQAKERELELKNQWATNRMTKKQTQAKYGF